MDEEISLKVVLKRISRVIDYFRKYVLLIILFGIVGGGVGFYKASITSDTYTAKLSFIVEEGKSASTGLGGLSALAGQFGLDASGGNAGGNLLSGENIFQYFKSQELIREVLLSKVDSSSDFSVGDIYLEVYGLNNSLSEGKNHNTFNFNTNNKSGSLLRVQDSVLKIISSGILTSQFEIERIDKKAGVIQVVTTMQDEKLSKLFCERLVELAVRNYINIKVKRQSLAVYNLQKRVDSIAQLLDKKIVSNANLQNSSVTMDINPLYKSDNTIAVEKTTRDKTLLSTMFSSALQSLELAKFSLNQETPVIQILDPVRFPLQRNSVSKITTALTYSLIFLTIITLIILMRLIITKLKTVN